MLLRFFAEVQYKNNQKTTKKENVVFRHSSTNVGKTSN